jgi:hypothetical protein
MKRKLSVKDPISKFITDYPREMKLPSNIFSPTLQEFMKPYKIKYFRLLHTSKIITKNEQLSFLKKPLAFEPGLSSLIPIQDIFCWE